MDIEHFLQSRTAFIRYFYENAVRPFNEIKNAIENEQKPYIPPYSEHGEPAFIEQWMDAEQGVQTVGHACISMLSASLHLFLKSWVGRLQNAHGMEFTANFRKKGWFRGYLEIFNKLELPLSQCPANLDVVEQIALARNRVQHPEEITQLGVEHSEHDLSKFPKPFFASEMELKMARRDGDDSATWWIRPSVKSSKEKIFDAISQVEVLCAWLEQQYRNTRNA